MRFDSERPSSTALGEQLLAAHEMTPELMTEILDVTCRRVPLQGLTAKALRLKQLIDARAWTDAALTLIERELPLWHIRRVTYDAGEWYCALSRQCELPDWLDQSIEGRHQDLALAVLTAFVEAQSAMAPSGRPSVPVVARATDADCIPLFCEDFA
jgi:hypothetical protein